MLTQSACLKKFTNVKTTLKSLLQKKNMCIQLLVIHCLHNNHLIQQKISMIVIEYRFYERVFKDLKEHATEIINYEKKRNDNTNL